MLNKETLESQGYTPEEFFEKIKIDINLVHDRISENETVNSSEIVKLIEITDIHHPFKDFPFSTYMNGTKESSLGDLTKIIRSVTIALARTDAKAEMAKKIYDEVGDVVDKLKKHEDSKRLIPLKLIKKYRSILDEQYQMLKMIQRENIIEALNYNALLELLKLGIVVISRDDLKIEDPDTGRNIHEFLFLASSETTRHLKLANQIWDMEQGIMAITHSLMEQSK